MEKENIETKISTDETDIYTSKESFVNVYKYALQKGNSRFIKTFLMGLASGIFIGFGYIAALMATRGDWGTIPPGIKSVIFGMVFTVAIIMIIFMGGEMFTSNSLALITVIKKQLTIRRFVTNLAIVLAGNFLGCLAMAALTAWSGFLHHATGDSADFFTNVSATFNTKLSHKWWENFVSGLLCNFLVAGSVYASHTTKSAIAKFFVVVVIIFAFAISGFSHVVANSYVWFIQPFLSLYGPTGGWTDFGKFSYDVQLPTLFGNFISGGLLLPFLYYFMFRKDLSPKITL